MFRAFILILALLTPLLGTANNGLFSTDVKSTSSLFSSDTPQAPKEITITTYEHQHSITLIFNIPDTYYLYKSRLKFSLEGAPNAKLGAINLPKGKLKNDPDFGVQEVYYHQMSTEVTVYGHIPQHASLQIRYQGCDGNICLPQQGKTIPLTIQGKPLPQSLSKSTITKISKKTNPDSNTSLSQTTTSIDKGSSTINPPTNSEEDYLGLLILLGLGLLLSFTPCVLPMIPILTGIIVGQSQNSRIAAFFLSISYVLGMAITYAVIGLLVSTLGAGFQPLLQTPTAIIISAIIFIALAMSMFGLFDINLSHKHHDFLRKIQNRHRTGSYIGAFIMGVISTAVLSPCTSAPLIGILTHIAQVGDYSYGALSLFTLAVGMGIPLLLIGTGFGQIVPKAGSWMIQIKQFFGVIMLAMAIWVLSRIMPSIISQLLYAILLIGFAITNGALERATRTSQRFIKAIGIILLTYGMCLLIGALSGYSSYLSPLKGITSPNTNTITTSENSYADLIVHTPSALDQAIAKMRQNHSRILIDYYASWCTACHIVSDHLQSIGIQQLIREQNIAIIKVDVSNYGEDTSKLLKQFHVLGMPTLVLLDKNGKETARHSGEATTKQLEQFLTHRQINTQAIQ